jgi:hypothetical protein
LPWLGHLLAAVFNPADYVLWEGMLQQKNCNMLLHRVAALHTLRAAVFWPGSTAGKAGLKGEEYQIEFNIYVAAGNMAQ